jgi:1-aminocyclopropane-1-carboxylate deaminase/D-cysteine desulfhydrase-like pyridoxal-dependent ACC family enzyme
MLFDTSNISLDAIVNDDLITKKLSLSVLRLDKIHPVVSGNKLFKLHYFLEDAINRAMPGILTFGGPYSNHLVATAFACKTANIKSVGVVRGEKPATLSATLTDCLAYGMQLHFVSRKDYEQKERPGFIQQLPCCWKNYLVIPEGGYHPTGAAGAALIMKFIPYDTTHICTALGTGTTTAGLLAGTTIHQKIIAIPVLKGMLDIEERMKFLHQYTDRLHVLNEYYFGGYAKKTPALLQFMNALYAQQAIPTDFVYTAKMMFAVFDSIDKNYFSAGSKIVCIHTGGLQGNASLSKGSLIF